QETSAGGTPALPAAPSHPRWLVPGLCAAGIVVALVLWNPWQKAAAPSSPTAKSTAKAPLSEARRLAAKADALFDQDDQPLRETLALAEQFCKQAITLDLNDAEVWAVYSRVISYAIFLTYERTQERRAAAGDAANRAMRLAPDSFEARYALAYFYRLDDATFPEAERILRTLATERPDDKRVWRTLGHSLRSSTLFAGN